MDLGQRVSVGVVVRYLLGALALGWVLTTVDWSRTTGLLGEMSLAVLGGVLAVTVLSIVPRIWMWQALLNHFEGGSFGAVLRADLVVKFVNSLFPSRLSGRSIAPLALRHFTGTTWSDATAITGAHTGLYVAWYGLASLVGLLALLGRLSLGVLAILAVSTAVYVVVGGLIVVGGWHLDRLEPALERVGTVLGHVPLVGDRLESLLGDAGPVVADAASGFRTVMADRRAVLGYGGGWLLSMALMPGLRVYLLFVGLGYTPETPLLLPLYLLTGYAVTILPLTPGGIGVAEATSTLVFVALGYPAAVVAPVIVLDRFLGVYLPALAGWYPAVTANLNEQLPTQSE